MSIFLLSVLVACTEPGPRIGPPEGVRALPSTGGHEVGTDLAIAGIYDRYGPHFGGMQAQAYLLPDGMNWAAIEAHYTDALPDWKADPRFPPRTGRTQARTWVQDGRVIVVERFETGGSPVLVVASNAPTPR